MLKIACIDDEKTFRDTVGAFLERYAEEKGLQYRVDYFDDGMSFMLQKREFYNLLLVDVDMPAMDGMRLAAKVREYDHRCLIVFITNLQNYAKLRPNSALIEYLHSKTSKGEDGALAQAFSAEDLFMPALRSLVERRYIKERWGGKPI